MAARFDWPKLLFNEKGRTPMRGLDGKVAIVPGGATKIGAAIVGAFRDAGVQVMIADINAEAGEALTGDGIAFQKTDLRDDAQIAGLVKATKEKFGRIDFLVNVACSYLDNGIESTRADGSKASMSTSSARSC
jgi:NAD(P)-dependent dehydrogenase (short-subunit alcohol dehydrogenase family)